MQPRKHNADGLSIATLTNAEFKVRSAEFHFRFKHKHLHGYSLKEFQKDDLGNFEIKEYFLTGYSTSENFAL